MVEYHSGSSDMIQSMNAKVVVRTKTSRAGALRALMRLNRALSPVRSCALAIFRMRNPQKNQIRKYPTVLPMKNGGFMYAALWPTEKCSARKVASVHLYSVFKAK